LLGLTSVVGCQNGEPNSSIPVQQVEFDLTVNEDRAHFREEGLQYQGSVGPYAVYKVTAANPRLIGPYVEIRKRVGYAMLCGARSYFSSASLGRVTMELKGGPSGTTTYVNSVQEASDEGDCADPKDVFGMPLPDGGYTDPDGPGGTPGSGDGADAGVKDPAPGTPGDLPGTGTTPCPNGGDGCQSGGSDAGSPDPTSDPVLLRLNIAFDRAPKVGSTVLLRRVALAGARQHNGSHVIPRICCKDGHCSLGTIQ
jgi:hypothetical protein